MSEKEILAIKKSIRKLKKEVLSSKESSLSFLVDAGLFNSDGSLLVPKKR